MRSLNPLDKVKVLRKQIVIECNLSREDWQLFNKNNADLVSEHLNRQLETAVYNCPTEEDAYNSIYRVMKQHADFGATDSEPMNTLDALFNHIYRGD